MPKYATLASENPRIPKLPAIAEINFVGVQLENLLLGEALLKFQRDHGFGNFSAPGALVGKEEGARYLHGDGAGALVMSAAVAKIGPRGAHNAHDVEAAMLEEALVFRGHDGVNECRGQILIQHRAALFAGAVKQIGDQFRLDFGAAQIGAASERTDGTNGFAGELHAQRVGTGRNRNTWTGRMSTVLPCTVNWPMELSSFSGR